MTGPTARLRENITSATALVVIGLSIVAFALSVPYAWVLFVLGLFVVVPLVGLLFGADDWRKWGPLSDEFWDDIFDETEAEADGADEDATGSEDALATNANVNATATGEDALETLRDRYARGELTDEQFERKLALLLETESIEDVEERFAERNRSEDRPEERDRLTDPE